MHDYLIVLAMTLLPITGNFLGGVLAERVQVSTRTLGHALYGAAGVVLAVVAIELLPEALDEGPGWLMVLAFVAGGGFFILMDRLIGIVQHRISGGDANVTPWAIFFGVSMDLFSDGLMIGTGSTIAVGLGFLLALGQMPADLPEGFATIATFRRQGISRRFRLLLTASFAVPIILGATIGYWAVRGQPDSLKLALLAFTAGMLITTAVQEMIPEAREDGESHLSTVVFLAGFALFTLLSIYVG